MLKWILVVAIVVAIPVALAVVGVFLPKGHRASRTVTLPASPERVFAAISDPERISKSDPPVTVELSTPNSRMVTRVAPGLPFGGTWTFDLERRGNGTSLTITEDGEVYNVLFRSMQKLFFSPYKTIDEYQAALAKALQ